MKQVFHQYTKWEDFEAGMWRKENIKYDENNLPHVIEFTGNHIEYGKAMMDVIDNWPNSCENFLSNVSINRKAWLGHAACCIKFGYPEYLVRKAWGHLTQIQRDLADKEALKAIALWEQNQRLKNTLDNGKSDVITQGYQMKLQMN